MVRILEERIIEGNKRYIEADGLSTDSKPTKDLVTGSFFLAVDTTEGYFFNEVSGTWIKAGGS